MFSYHAPQWYLYLLEHVRVVTDLPQLHDGVHQRLCASFTLVNTKRTACNHNFILSFNIYS